MSWLSEHKVLVFWLLFVPLFFLNQGLRINDRGLGDDSREFWAAAYHVAHGQGFSIAQNSETAEPLDAYRPPAYPAFLSLFIKLSPDLIHDDFSWYFHPKVDPGKLHAPAGMVAVKWFQAGLLFISALLAMGLARSITRSAACGYGALILVSLHPFLTSFSHRYYSEMLAAFLITLFAWLFHRCLKHRGWLDFFLAGLTLGLLTLTRAQWYYLGFFCLAYLVFAAWRIREARTRLLIGALIVLFCSAALVTPWKLRNQQLFGRAFITERAGIALDLRSRYATMTNKEILASFVYWSRSAGKDALLETLFQPEDYTGLVRETGYYRAALDRSGQLEAQHPRAEADRIQFNEAKQRLLANIWGYVRTLPSMTYRGMVDGHLSLLNLAFYLLFAVGLLALVRRGDWIGLGALWPFLGLWAFNSLITHNLDRFNGAGTSLLLVGAVVGWQAWALRKRKSQRSSNSA